MTRFDRRAFVAVVVAGLIVALLATTAGGVSAQIEPAPEGLIWLALGDSFSSGEGLRYIDQQANPPDQTCERATGNTSVNNGKGSEAYARVAYDRLRGSWEDSDFELLACTGATSNQIHDQYRDRRFSDRDADIVTVSMGGNNVKFDDIVKGCIGLSKESAVTAVGARLSGRWLRGLDVRCKRLNFANRFCNW